MEPEKKKCPACEKRRRHTLVEFRIYHRHAGQGCADGKWTTPELQEEADKKKAAAAKS